MTSLPAVSSAPPPGGDADLARTSAPARSLRAVGVPPFTPSDDAEPTAIDPTAPMSPLSVLVLSALRLTFAGASAGLFVALLRVDSRRSLILSNDSTPEVRKAVLLAFGLGAVFGVVLPALYARIRGKASFVEVFERVSLYATPLILAGFIPPLFDGAVFRGESLLFGVTLAVFGVGLERSLRLAIGALPQPWAAETWAAIPRAFPRVTKRAPQVALVALFLFFAIYMSYYSVQNHYNLATTSWDLGIFDNMMWNLIRGKWFKASPDLGRTGSHIQYHATFLAYLFAPFYALRQKADTLLVLQATFAGAAVFPLYLLARRRMATAAGALVLCYAYVVHGPLHQPVFYDFHFLTTAPFWIGCVLWFFETNRKWGLIAAYACAVMLREDQSATLATAGFFYLISGQRARWALAGGALSAGYFLLMKFLIMPLHVSGAPKESFSWMYVQLIPKGEHGFGAVLKTLLANPIYTLKTLLIEEKFSYVLRTFGPVIFLSFRHPKVWVLHLAPVIFTLLATGYAPPYQTNFQYTSNYTAYLFFGAAVVIGSWRFRRDAWIRMPAALIAILFTATAGSVHDGAIFSRTGFRGGFTTVRFVSTEEDRKNIRDLYDLAGLIPKNASVAATEHEAPHVSNREDCFTFRFGYDEADYLLLAIDEGRAGSTHDYLQKAVSSGQYGFIDRKGKFALWGRGKPTTKNAEGISIFGLKAEPTPPSP